MELAIQFVLAVVSSMLSYYICKWLDSQRKGR